MVTAGQSNSGGKVTDWFWPGVMQTSPYALTVSYHSLARTLRFSRCNNGKINRITVRTTPSYGASETKETESISPLVNVKDSSTESAQPFVDIVLAPQLKTPPEITRPFNGLIERLLSMFKKHWRLMGKSQVVVKTESVELSVDERHVAKISLLASHLENRRDRSTDVNMDARDTQPNVKTEF